MVTYYPIFPYDCLMIFLKKLILSHIIPYFPYFSMFYDIPYWCDRKKKKTTDCWWFARWVKPHGARVHPPAQRRPVPLKGPWPWSPGQWPWVSPSIYIYIYKRQYIDIHRFQSRKRGIKDFHQDVGHCVPQWSFQYFKRQGIAGLQIQLQ